MAARKPKPKSADTQAQPDPKAPLDSAALLKSATPVLKLLAADLLSRADGSPSITKSMQARHGKEKSEERTADNYDTWRRDFVEQVAAAWFLSCVFVRTLEDRGLIDRNRLAGPGAEDSQRAFFALVPSLNERDYLLTVFRELQQLPAARELFDARHNPVWLLGPSAEAAKELLGLFRTPQADAPMFRFGNADSRFLGDLYQDISENVRKRYALLQTPRFVERFILDRTLDPAIERFGLNDTNLIDPTCGSGHFLLGALDRLFERRLQVEPGLDVRQAAAKALDAVAGSDVNPYAVAIAKFRLTLSFIEKAGYSRLKDAPKLPLHVIVADSLLHNPNVKQMMFGDKLGESVADWKGSEFKLEDEIGAKEVLNKPYAAVVGNPPYITVKDAALREKYRKIYPDSAGGKYSLAAPFCEQFFRLGRPRGYVGMITANSFMKREFGKKLIEKYLRSVNLETVINTSGAYIPGHGTPTVLLFGTAEKPQTDTVLTVLASRGEPSTPEDPETGHVWGSIANHWYEVGFENEYITITRTDRESLAKHPWSLGGGGATELKELLERTDKRLVDVTTAIGFDAIMGEDEIFVGEAGWLSRLGAPLQNVRNLGIGENIRDWAIATPEDVLFPYDSNLMPIIPPSARVHAHLWRYRSVLANRQQFGKSTVEAGLQWFEYRSFYKSKRSTLLAIAFAEVATHNHFVLDRGSRVFKQTAPIVKLSPSATEEEHYALLAYLNSSTVAFYLRQVAHQKQMMGADSIRHTDPTTVTFAFNGASVSNIPVPKLDSVSRQRLAWFGKNMSDLAEARASLVVSFQRDKPGANADSLLKADLSMLQKLVSLQEDLDWYVYYLLELIDEEEFRSVGKSENLLPGMRAFEVRLRLETGVLRTIDSSDIADPHHSSKDVQDRLTIIGLNSNVAFIEQPQFKRRWIGRQGKFNHGKRDFESILEDMTRRESLDAFEQQFNGATIATPVVFRGFRELTRKDILAESMPFLAAYRYADSGLETLAVWERTWENQRREDAGESNVTCGVPPKYEQEDFRDASYWRLRGKLDVPKERFISYLGCESDEDHEPVYGWAGWNHLQRAQALAQLYNDRRAEGWRAERLIPMLAGLLELLPWLLQWHNEPSEELGGQRPGEQFALFLEGQCAEWGLTHEDLRSWRPKAKRARAAGNKKGES